MFRVLGPLEVSEQRLTVRGLRQRAALGHLLLRHDSEVAVTKLEKALWPFEVPPTGRQMVYNAVHALRRAGLPMTKTTRGYRLVVDPHSIDVVRFQELFARGKAELAQSHWEAASRLLGQGLELWRGNALADLADEGLRWPEMAALDNARLTALEYRVEAEFRMGRHGEVVGELEAFVETEPLRERLCAQLMRALYHSGRQADALGLYRRTRTGLIEQLGLEPSPALRQLEHAILNHELEAPVELRLVASHEERLIREHAGIEDGDSADVVAAKLRWIVRRVLGSGDQAQCVRKQLVDLLSGVRTDETVRAAGVLLEKITLFHHDALLSS